MIHVNASASDVQKFRRPRPLERLLSTPQEEVPQADLLWKYISKQECLGKFLTTLCEFVNVDRWINLGHWMVTPRTISPWSVEFSFSSPLSRSVLKPDDRRADMLVLSSLLFIDRETINILNCVGSTSSPWFLVLWPRGTKEVFKVCDLGLFV